jgi:hypothetical protein
MELTKLFSPTDQLPDLLHVVGPAPQHRLRGQAHSTYASVAGRGTRVACQEEAGVLPPAGAR